MSAGKSRNKYNICVVTGTRAEYGLLKPLLYKLKNSKDFLLKLAVTGSHLNGDLGNTQQEIIGDGFSIAVRVPLPLEDNSNKGMVLATSKAMSGFAEYFDKDRPDMLIVLGDRYEILAAGIAAHFMRIPIAHISGGDITEGAIDNSIRHCLTKLSDIHFPGCKQSADRIIQMGENPECVFNVGELGVENCLNMPLMSLKELADDLGFPGVMEDFCVVTFHPATMEEASPEKQVYELIEAMDLQKNMSYIITLANADAGGRLINAIWEKECLNRKNWYVIPSLGVVRYLSAVKYAKAVVGNSSSGLIEAPALGTPTINIGSRQKGRMQAKSVVSCVPIADDIKSAFIKVLSDDFRLAMHDQVFPFGKGDTSDIIAKNISSYLDIHIKCKVQ